MHFDVKNGKPATQFLLIAGTRPGAASKKRIGT
jgi:hypothetical protein